MFMPIIWKHLTDIDKEKSKKNLLLPAQNKYLLQRQKERKNTIGCVEGNVVQTHFTIKQVPAIS